MAIQECDYFSVFVREDFYGDIYRFREDKDIFNKWVADNFNELITINSFGEVAPPPKIIESVVNKGYVHRESQCHYSAKAATLLCDVKELKYTTGFVFRPSASIHAIVAHSFNQTEEGVIIDFARLNKDFTTLENHYSLPHIYNGIIIPKEFVERYSDETFKRYSMRPLLYEWYCEVNGLDNDITSS